LELATGEREKDALPSEFASPEHLQRGTTDFRSAIYSLGATMCFLLTGTFYSAEPRSSQTRRFVRPLRSLITPMLRQNPDERPQDPVLFTEAVRSCLRKVERRQALARHLGLTFAATKPVRARQRPHLAPIPLEEPDLVSQPATIVTPGPAPGAVTTRPRWWMPRAAMAAVAVLFVLGAAAALLLPAPVSWLAHRNRDKELIGVPVGIPESSALAMARNSSSTASPAVSASPLSSPSADVTSPATSAQPANNVIASNNRAASSTQTVQPPPAASSPAPVSANESVAAVTNQPVTDSPPAVSQATAASEQTTEQPSSPEPAASPSTTHEVVADNASTRPVAPAEGPQTMWERETGTKQKFVAQSGGDE